MTPILKPKKKARAIVNDFLDTISNFYLAKEASLLHIDIMIDFCIDNNLMDMSSYYIKIRYYMHKIDTPF